MDSPIGSRDFLVNISTLFQWIGLVREINLPETLFLVSKREVSSRLGLAGKLSTKKCIDPTWGFTRQQIGFDQQILGLDMT